MANIRVRHTKIFKYLTISAATLGVVSSGAFAVMMGIDATNENFINDNLREYADKGHVNEIIKDYREHNAKILELINNLVVEQGVEVTLFKINFIEPLGKK